MKNFFKGNRLLVITILFFLVLVTFVDKNNLVDSWQVRQNIRALEDQKAYYLKKIAEDSAVLENLKDDDYLERFARENYLMKRTGETIYVVK
ncbi:MAG: septum formation initiator family protein [Rikenellaceae bacterium]|jgi:cell division protein FtsB|nr:septum formation initiator family protein [Rikenellaceae bacterium]